MDKQTIKDLQNCVLFKNVSDIPCLLDCFNVKIINFKKNEQLAGYEDKPAIIIITAGKAITVDEDYYGNRSVISSAEKGSIFGAAYVFGGMPALTARIVATEDGRAVYLSGNKILCPCQNSCPSHTAFVCNATKVISNRCVTFLEKLEILSKRTTREKVLSYLSAQSKKQAKNKFDIEFSRQELADYLAVDRSALSAELSRMQSDGLISYKRNHFELK